MCCRQVTSVTSRVSGYLAASSGFSMRRDNLLMPSDIPLQAAGQRILRCNVLVGGLGNSHQFPAKAGTELYAPCSQERRADIDCDALEADLAAMRRAAEVAAATKTCREALAR